MEAKREEKLLFWNHNIISARATGLNLSEIRTSILRSLGDLIITMKDFDPRTYTRLAQRKGNSGVEWIADSQAKEELPSGRSQ